MPVAVCFKAVIRRHSKSDNITRMECPVVSTRQGRLKGRTAIDHFGRTYYSFQGIPYAKPPLGELRFKVNLRFI